MFELKKYRYFKKQTFACFMHVHNASVFVHKNMFLGKVHTHTNLYLYAYYM